MRHIWMKIVPAMAFVLILSAAAYAGHSVTIKNTTGNQQCSATVYHRTLGTTETGHMWLDPGQENTVTAPGAYCIAYLDYHCCPAAGGICTDSKTVGCLGTSGSKGETCCWSSTWEFYTDPQTKEQKIRKTKP